MESAKGSYLTSTGEGFGFSDGWRGCKVINII